MTVEEAIMKLRKVLLYFLGIFIVTLIVSSIVTFFYSWIAHGDAMVEWGTSFRLAIILGFVMTWVEARDNMSGK